MPTHVDVSSVFTHVALCTVQTITWCRKSKRRNAIKEIDEETISVFVNLQYQALQQVVRLGDGVDDQTSDGEKAINGLTSPSWLSAVLLTVLLHL